MTATFPEKGIIILCLTASLFSLSAVNGQSPLDRPFNREILDNYRRKSDEYVSKNLNRFALDRLQVYDRLLDSLYAREKSDTLASIEANYKLSAAERLASIASLKKEIEEQSIEKASLENGFWSLVRYAGLAFVVWLGLVLLFVRFRRMRVKKAERSFETSATQLESLEDLTEKAQKLFADFKSKKEKITSLERDLAKLEQLANSQKENAADNPSVQPLTVRTEKLRKTIDAEKRIIDSVLSQSLSKDNEKTLVDINSICDAYMEIAFRGLEKSETFNCQVTRDFEKKLPGLQMNPSAVGTLLLNVISNAFESVKEKNELGIKGYQPKVSISTRILPKFLQVRIKDNGTGMNDKLLQEADKEFFTTRTLNPRPGLGLSIAKSIIEEHKGEIKIESEEGNSTDVYIKFYLK